MQTFKSMIKYDDCYWSKTMSFKDDYTTSDLILSQSSIKPEDLPKDTKKEINKTVLSNDFYMLGQYLECINNRMGRL